MSQEKKKILRYRSTGLPVFAEDRMTDADRAEEAKERERISKQFTRHADTMEKIASHRESLAPKPPTLIEAAEEFEKDYSDLWKNLGTRVPLIQEVQKLEVVAESVQREGRSFNWRDELRGAGERVRADAGFKSGAEQEREEVMKEIRESRGQ